MPHGGKNDQSKAGDVGALRVTAVDQETVGDALSKVGFEPAKVGRKIVSQGKRRENLKRPAYRVPDK
ncbi:hypothetical protein B5K05_13470 [Rhizobium phaseoli]|nr:hypothetical protein B5K04_13445 [Rhizobium phaseoli]RDJ14134.1 hypothetical protein B5K05_13470 [Rhizobium phaseoli]